MAQHYKIGEIKLLEDFPIQKRNLNLHNNTIEKALVSIYKRLKYFIPYITRTKVWGRNFVYQRQFTRLPKDYSDYNGENYIPFLVGEYDVGKKISPWKAMFELHYDPIAKHGIIYMVL